MPDEHYPTSEMNGVARGDPKNPYAYTMPVVALLTEGDEQSLAASIKTAAEAAVSLREMLAPELCNCIFALELRPEVAFEVANFVDRALDRLIHSFGHRIPRAEEFCVAFAEQVARAIAGSTHATCTSQDLDHLRHELLRSDKFQEAIVRCIQLQSDLWSTISVGLRSINRLVEAHMPLAKRFAQAAIRRVDELDDLIDEAAIILRRCAEKFRPEPGSRFSSYAKKALIELKRRSPSNSTTRYTARQVKLADQEATRQTKGGSDDDQLVELFGNDNTRKSIENARVLMMAQSLTRAGADKADMDPKDQCKSPYEQLVDGESKTLLLCAFQRLSWLEKKTLVGKVISGQSFRDLGKRYHKSPNTISKIYEKARAKIARELDPDRKPTRPR